MRVAELESKRVMSWTERSIPSIGKHEALIKLKHVGLCGSDLHFYEDGRLGNWVPDGPLVLGHESAGIVVEVGECVTNLMPGDRVALEPGVSCGQCEWCKKGLYNLCENISFMAIPHERDGVFSEYCAHPANMCYKLPDNVTTLEGALCEPLCVGLHAVGSSGAKIGQNAVVFGSGCIGLVTMMALQSAGIKEIYMIDVIDKRLEKAYELGATKCLNPVSAVIGKEIMDLTDGKGVDNVFEASGNAASILLSAKLLKKAGTITLIGMSSKPEVLFDMASLMDKEAQIKTVFRYRNLYPTAINLLRTRSIELEKIVTHLYPFEKVIEGVEYNADNRQDVIKAAVHFE